MTASWLIWIFIYFVPRAQHLCEARAAISKPRTIYAHLRLAVGLNNLRKLEESPWPPREVVSILCEFMVLLLGHALFLSFLPKEVGEGFGEGSQIWCQILPSSVRIQFPGKGAWFMRRMNGWTFPLTPWNNDRSKAGYLRMPVAFPAGVPTRQSLATLLASGPCCEATGLNLSFFVTASLNMGLAAGHPEGTAS